MSLRSKREHSDVSSVYSFFPQQYPEEKSKIKKSTEVKCEQKAVAKYKSKLKPCENVKIDEVLLCKMKGYCEWPCLVTRFEKNLIKIEFFGDHTTHKAAISNFFHLWIILIILYLIWNPKKMHCIENLLLKRECWWVCLPKNIFWIELFKMAIWFKSVLRRLNS